jgi:hypothetical protein
MGKDEFIAAPPLPHNLTAFTTLFTCQRTQNKVPSQQNNKVPSQQNVANSREPYIVASLDRLSNPYIGQK